MAVVGSLLYVTYTGVGLASLPTSFIRAAPSLSTPTFANANARSLLRNRERQRQLELRNNSRFSSKDRRELEQLVREERTLVRRQRLAEEAQGLRRSWLQKFWLSICSILKPLKLVGGLAMLIVALVLCSAPKLNITEIDEDAEHDEEERLLARSTPTEAYGEQQELVYRHVRKPFSGMAGSVTKKSIKRSLTARKEIYKELLDEVPIDKMAQMILEMAAAKIFRNQETAKLYFPSVFSKSLAVSDVTPSSGAHGDVTESIDSESSAIPESSGSPTSYVAQEPMIHGVNPAEVEDMILHGIKEVRPILGGNMTTDRFPPPFIMVPEVPPVALPYLCQHHVMMTVQTSLEEAFFDYCKTNFPHILENNVWDSPMAIELTKWPKILSAVQSTFPDPSLSKQRKGGTTNIPIEVAMRPLSPIRHIAVHRIPVVAKTIVGLLEYGHRIAGYLGDEERKSHISNCMGHIMGLTRPIEADMAKIRQQALVDVMELERQRNELIKKQREVLARMAEDYRNLKQKSAPHIAAQLLNADSAAPTIIKPIDGIIQDKFPEATPGTEQKSKAQAIDKVCKGSEEKLAKEEAEKEVSEAARAATEEVLESQPEEQFQKQSTEQASVTESPEKKIEEHINAGSDAIAIEAPTSSFQEKPTSGHDEVVITNPDVSEQEITPFKDEASPGESTERHTKSDANDELENAVVDSKTPGEDEIQEGEEVEEEEEDDDEYEDDYEGDMGPDESVYSIDQDSLIGLSPLEQAKNTETERYFYTFEKNRIKAEVDKEFSSQKYVPSSPLPDTPDFDKMYQEKLDELFAKNVEKLGPKRKKTESAVKGARTTARKQVEKEIAKKRRAFKQRLTTERNKEKAFAKELADRKKKVVTERLRCSMLAQIIMENYRLDAEVEKAALLLHDCLTHTIYSTNHGLINAYANNILSKPESTATPESGLNKEALMNVQPPISKQDTPIDTSEASQTMNAEMEAIEVEINAYSNSTAPHGGEYDFIVERLELDEQEKAQKKLLKEPSPAFEHADIEDANSALSAHVDLRTPGSPDTLSRELQQAGDLDFDIPAIQVPTDFPESTISPDRMIVSSADVPEDLPYARIAPERIVVAPVEFEVPDNVADFEALDKDVDPLKALQMTKVGENLTTQNEKPRALSAQILLGDMPASGAAVSEASASEILADKAAPKIKEDEISTVDVAEVERAVEPKAGISPKPAASETSKTTAMAEAETFSEAKTPTVAEVTKGDMVEAEVAKTSCGETPNKASPTKALAEEAPPSSESPAAAEESPKPLLSRLTSWFRKSD
ncbi:putative lysosomal cobalamin transporter [Ceratocystis platani]|uniref:Putative lysosomal cobalamin transporter n=1 Tax=Ceratocystis fimbriata f. sp. platani TaxID=88771 RepID=A0A0F8D3C1_CERFI|nr:putative lysosomal cobalamin transporter [Ceratocystis platani]